MRTRGPVETLLALTCAALVLACGGNVEGGDGERPEGAEAEAKGGSAAPGGGGAGEDEKGAGEEPGDLRLEECELGFPLEEAEGPCNWLAKNRCYETKLAACSCVCPRTGPSVCSSAFYGGEDSRTRVTCF